MNRELGKDIQPGEPRRRFLIHNADGLIDDQLATIRQICPNIVNIEQ